LGGKCLRELLRRRAAVRGSGTDGASRSSTRQPISPTPQPRGMFRAEQRGWSPKAQDARLVAGGRTRSHGVQVPAARHTKTPTFASSRRESARRETMPAA
jgi:hypothetical protein